MLITYLSIGIEGHMVVRRHTRVIATGSSLEAPADRDGPT